MCPEYTATDFTPLKRTEVVQSLSRPSLSYWQDAWIRLKKNQYAILSLAIIIGLLLFTIIGPFIWTVDPAYQDLARISEGPSKSKLMKVSPELPTFEQKVIADFPAEGKGEASQLPATEKLISLSEIQTTQGVRFEWAPVVGASGYAIYKSDVAPNSKDDLGIPLATVDAANKVSFEDTFDVKPGTFWYSVVATKEVEANTYKTIKVTVEQTVAIAEAQKIDPNAQPGSTVKLMSHPLGTDYLGRDMLSRLMSGARVSLFIGFVSPILSILIGIFVGGFAGFLGGKTDAALMRFTDFVLALPFLLFMILFRVAFGAQPGESGIGPMLFALVALSWTSSARLVRGQVLQLRESEFVQAARLLGANPTYIIFRHLLPNTLGVILVESTFSIPAAIFTEAFLSFIGMGVAPPTPSWGSMCNDGTQTFLTHPHEFFFPALFISLTVLAFNLLGDGLRDALDPRMRSTG